MDVPSLINLCELSIETVNSRHHPSGVSPEMSYLFEMIFFAHSWDQMTLVNKRLLKVSVDLHL